MSVDSTSDPLHSLTAIRGGDRALIEITDTGIGMEAQGMTRAFNLFTQVHDAQLGAEGGLGVGLSLAKTIVQLQGGDITINSQGHHRGCNVLVSPPV